MSTKLPEPPSSYSQTWASQTLRLIERSLTTITGIQTALSELPTTYQPLDGDLTAIAALTGTGMPERTADNTWSIRTVGEVGRSLLALASAGAIRFIRVNADGSVTLRADSDMRADLGLGTMATQNASAVAITGGNIDATAVGAATRATGAFTTLSAVRGSNGDVSTWQGAGSAKIGYLYSDGTYIGLFDAASTAGSGILMGEATPKLYGFVAGSIVTTTAAGSFAVSGTLSCTGNATIGDAATDTVDVKGRIFGSNLHDNASGLSGASYIGSGTYTPTITSVTNVAATTAYVCQYMRVGNVVTVSGRIDVDPTSATVTTEVRVSLPIASDFLAVGNLGGTGVFEFNFESVRIYADAVNNDAFFQWLPANSSNQTLTFHFTYVVL